MIKLCRILDAVNGSHVGYYVNGGVMFEVLDIKGRITKWNCQYNADLHVITEDDQFNAKMLLWRKFYYETKRLCPRFVKTRLWKECITIRLLFERYDVFCNHLEQMKNLNVITVDGKYLRLGELP